MSNYGAIVTTQLGKNMIAESFKTKKGIIFTKVALGEGLLNSGNIKYLLSIQFLQVKLKLYPPSITEP